VFDNGYFSLIGWSDRLYLWIEHIIKRQRRGKYQRNSPSESSWSVKKSGQQFGKNGLGVDALTGIVP
jgi:hypothetical protein